MLNHEDPDSNEARLAAHRRLHSCMPEGHTPPKPALVVELEERLAAATLELTAALDYIDNIRLAKPQDIAYETMQRSGFRRPNWKRKFTLADAKRYADTAATRLRNAWEILDPTGRQTDKKG